MYEEYYGLVEKPFSLTPDPKYLYKSESHAAAFDLLQYAVRRREGFVVISGDIGTGKTTLCRALLEQIDRNTFSALVLNPFLSEEDLLRLILQDFGVVSREEVKGGRLAGVSKQELIDTLYDFLLSLLPLRAGAVLIIDEAQNLPLQVLEQIRILSNLETDKEKLLQIVLVGQLNLNTLLRSPEMRQLDQRVSIRYELQPLTPAEVAAYVAHRLSIAGGSGIAFEPRSLQLIHKLSGGIPRLVNLICDRTLLAAYTNRLNRIGPETVRKAATSLDLHPPRRTWRIPWPRRKASIAAAAVAAVGLSVALGSGFGPETGLVASAAPGGRDGSAASLQAPFGDSAGSTEPVDAGTAAAGERRTEAAPAQPVTVISGLPEEPFTVVAGSFEMNAARPESASRVASMTATLAAMGYDVYHVDVNLGPHGLWRQVLVGGYDGMDDARRDERRLKATTEFEEARAVRSSAVASLSLRTP